MGSIDFTLRPQVDRWSQRMGVRERHFQTTMRQTGDFENGAQLMTALQDGLVGAMNQVLESDMADQDRLYFTISSNRLISNYQGWNLTASEWRNGGSRVDAVFTRLANALNSNENFELNDSFNVSITRVRHAPLGLGHKRNLKPGHRASSVLKRKKDSVIQIKNKDDMCCGRAIAVAKARIDHDPDWRNIRQGRKVQEDLAVLQYWYAGVKQGPCGYDELTKFQNALPDYRLIVVDADRGFSCKAFSPPGKPEIVLLYENNHYDVITSLPGFFGTSYVCAHCLIAYNDEGKHRCKMNTKFCRACRQQDCPDFLEALPRGNKATVRCHECHRDFFGEVCFQNHLTKNRQQKTNSSTSICQSIRRCPNCFKLEDRPENIMRHKCGFARCPSCQDYVLLKEHKCFIQPPKRKRQEKERQSKRQRLDDNMMDSMAVDEKDQEDDEMKAPVFVYFDIEAMQVGSEHKPNLLVAETDESEEPIIFEDSGCVKNFLEWLEELTEDDSRNVTVIAHNFQGYDGYFVVNEYYGSNQLIQQLRNGCKLLEVQHDSIRFIDSLSFMAMPLSAFPKTFGIKELKKGYFPHLFNRPENQDYVGPVPARDYYMTESMSPKGKEEFEKWHEEQRRNHVVFDFAKEIIEYCKSDVKLLKQGCITFKEKWCENSTFNPFECVTIASACNRDLRENHLIPQSIASEPVHGWKPQANQSNVAREWLHWVDSQLEEGHVQHVDNVGEFLIPGTSFHADGYCQENNTVYEFNGCFFHGCPSCYPVRYEKHQRLDDLTFSDVYERTKKRVQTIRSKGFNVVTMWECEWRKMKKEKPEIEDFVKRLEFTEPLNPRDAFSGGRTNATKLYVKAEPNQKIRYIDYTSLYPWVNKTARYPVGHPTFISQPGTTDISEYFGFVKCRIVPPYGLYHPVLPSRKEEKLTFPLCPSCVEENLKKPLLMRSPICHHTRAQRTLTGTWCTPELEKAVELGYEIEHVYEVWHFEESREGLFESYVNNWLKLKQEASGWPSDVGNDEQNRQEYIRNYYEKEGILLDYNKIAYNPGLRSVAKIALNSMWGKFGQNLNKTQIKAFNDPREFHQFLESDSIEVLQVAVRNEDIVEVQFRYREKDVKVNPNLNIFIAAFTTCWARLRLYEALELLGNRVIYYDTDSVVFLENSDDPNQVQPQLGNYLGDFTDECDPGDYIIEFVSGGPKNYGYVTKNGKVECKVRGFRLNAEGKAQLNYNIMRDNVLAEIKNPLDKPREHQVIKSYQIMRNAKDYTLETHPESKFYKLVYDKRVIYRSTFDTLPYGFYQGQ